jgi:hypothetical protein
MMRLIRWLFSLPHPSLPADDPLTQRKEEAETWVRETADWLEAIRDEGFPFEADHFGGRS